MLWTSIKIVRQREFFLTPEFTPLKACNKQPTDERFLTAYQMQKSLYQHYFFREAQIIVVNNYTQLEHSGAKCGKV